MDNGIWEDWESEQYEIALDGELSFDVDDDLASFDPDFEDNEDFGYEDLR